MDLSKIHRFWTTSEQGIIRSGPIIIKNPHLNNFNINRVLSKTVQICPNLAKFVKFWGVGQNL